MGRARHDRVAIAAGGGNDIVARVIARALTGKLAKTVIVENKPGAGGVNAVRVVRSAAPDGRTLLYSASITEIQSAKDNPLYDLRQDLVPVIAISEGPLVLYVASELPVNSLQQLIEFDTRNPGKLSYASFGVGSVPHLSFELLKQRTKMTMVHVPYRSALEAQNAVLTNQVQLSMETYASVLQQIDSGKFRAIAVTGTKRERRAPEVPTIIESGVSDFEITTTSGLLAPKGTPVETINLLNEMLNAALRDPEVPKAIDRVGWEVVGGPASRYQASLQKSISEFRKLILAAGLTF